MDLRIVITDENGEHLKDLVVYQDGSDSEGAESIASYIRHNFTVESEDGEYTQ